MNFELKPLGAAGLAADKSDLLLYLVGDGFAPGSDALSALTAQALKAGDFATQAGKSLALYQVPGLSARRVLLLGAGDASARSVRQALNAASAALRAPKTARVVLAWAQAPTPEAVATALQGVAEATYAYTLTKSKAEARQLQKVRVAVADTADMRAAVLRAQALVAGVELAREWGNRPANHATPSMLATAARALAKHRNVQCRVLEEPAIRKLGMGAFLAVARGSEEAPRFIELRYEGAAKQQAPVVLVGKGITFDTGGISIKPAPEMDEMKFDMCGAASVLGVFQALAVLQPAINVVGLIPACENMPDGRALKPGDVVTSMSGLTIEVLNTDAEGRLILCDALAYADRFKPAAVVDIATLTGACVIALGGVRSGLFSNNDGLAASLQAAGDAALDPCWRMPLDDDYAEGLKSPFADMGNVAGRAAGSVTAAKFLQRFVKDWPWAHLDIAGTAWRGGAQKGASGRPVPLLLEYLLRHASPPPAQGAAEKPRAARKTRASRTSAAHTPGA
ncbi:leucyl aminopeptidase [Acidovorax lacteus]|uniref:Probable cytosol aminopeptidase n=1 Tax=Acidovorax lacteus TaxID=1924988 RepID=A0ABP8L4T6_9BURK